MSKISHVLYMTVPIESYACRNTEGKIVIRPLFNLDEQDICYYWSYLL